MKKKWANNTEDGKKGFQPTTPRPASPLPPIKTPDRSLNNNVSPSPAKEAPISAVYSIFTYLTDPTASPPTVINREQRVKTLRSMLWQGPPNQQTDMAGKVPLVVYGTLRSGEELDDGILDGSTYTTHDDSKAEESNNPPSPRETAYIRGRIYKSTEGDWPLLDTKETGWVSCEVVSMDTDPETGTWNKIGTDEIAWGYNVEYVTVYDSPGEEGEPVGTALVCVWPWQQHRGEHITSGDWLTR